MARADKTFSAADLIRYWTVNLTRDEQEEVRCFFFILEIAQRDKERALDFLIKLLLKLALKFPFLEKLLLVVFEVLDELESRDECLKRLRKLSG
jgi:hypothetical protein